ncbi:hypothetical protein ACP70R_005455 [Stipagrostis hirtigluma subsp. patula]
MSTTRTTRTEDSDAPRMNTHASGSWTCARQLDVPCHDSTKAKIQRDQCMDKLTNERGIDRYVSLYLALDEDVAMAVKARVQFSVVVEKRDLFFRKSEKKVICESSDLRTFASRGSHWGLARFALREKLRGMVPPSGGPLTIRCEVVVFKKFRAEEEEAPKATRIPVPPPDLQRHLGDLLQSGRGADVVFEAGGETFAAHRCVLAARSPVISAELFGAGAGAGDPDAADGVVRVEAPVFRALLRFAYTDALPAMSKEEEGDVYEKLLVAADRYHLERLKLICANELCDRVDAGRVKAILALAERHRCAGLKEACLGFLSDPGNLRAAIDTHGL